MMDTTVYDPFDERYCLTHFHAEENPATCWETFAIVTACNPMGRSQSAAKNLECMRDLAHAIAELGFESMRVNGIDPNGGHVEESFAVHCGSEVAQQLCQRYEQLAYYMVSAGELTLHSTNSNSNISIAQWEHRLQIQALRATDEFWA